MKMIITKNELNGGNSQDIIKKYKMNNSIAN